MSLRARFRARSILSTMPMHAEAALSRDPTPSASQRCRVLLVEDSARLAASIRARARRRAMARARTVPVRLLFPLVFLVLPAFLLLTVAPVVLASSR